MSAYVNLGAPNGAPSEALARRLDDPATAEALGTLLDNAELLAVLVQGLAGFVARSDTIVEAFAGGVSELKTAAGGQAAKLPSLAEAGTIAGQLSEALPIINHVLESKMLDPATIEMLAEVSSATTQGFNKARDNDVTVTAFGAFKALREPEVQRGLGYLIEIARALGRSGNK